MVLEKPKLLDLWAEKTVFVKKGAYPGNSSKS